MTPPKEPKRKKRNHVVFAIFRTLGINYDRENKLLESFQTELAQFLDAGFSVIGAGMSAPGYGKPNLIFAIVTKEL